MERAGANVMWSLLSRNTYRTGHMGEVRFGKLMPSTGLEAVIQILHSRTFLFYLFFLFTYHLGLSLDTEHFRPL